jgi:hypothetical protein
MQTFRISRQLEAVCQSESTRYGFRHVATLLRNGNEIASTKHCYYNRTWESYEFESVLQSLAEKAKPRLSKYEEGIFRGVIKNGGRHATRHLKTVAMVMAIGDLFGQNQKTANDWKTRMLKAGLANKGLIMPEDWDQLSEDDKEKRLNDVIQALQ